MIDFNLTEEQHLLRDSVERFVRSRCSFLERQKLARTDQGFSEENWKAFAEFGWLGLVVPQDLGGLGCSVTELAVVMEAFGRGLVLEPYLASSVLAVRLLAHPKASAASQALVRGIVEGEARVTLAHAEPSLRYDLSQVRETSFVADERGFVLNGVKTAVLGAPSAGTLIVSAKAADAADASGALFLVDRDALGVSISPYRLLDRTWAGDVRLSDVRIANDRRLLAPSDAPAALEEAIDWAIVGACAEVLGAMEEALAITAEHLKTRVQFGQPLGKFQALQHRMAEMFVEAQESRSILYRSLVHMERDPARRGEAVSAAKALIGEAALFVGANCVQLHGGIGITEENRIGHYYTKMLLFEKLFGDTDHHMDRFAASRHVEGRNLSEFDVEET